LPRRSGFLMVPASSRSLGGSCTLLEIREKWMPTTHAGPRLIPLGRAKVARPPLGLWGSDGICSCIGAQQDPEAIEADDSCWSAIDTAGTREDCPPPPSPDFGGRTGAAAVLEASAGMVVAIPFWLYDPTARYGDGATPTETCPSPVKPPPHVPHPVKPVVDPLFTYHSTAGIAILHSLVGTNDSMLANTRGFCRLCEPGTHDGSRNVSAKEQIHNKDMQGFSPTVPSHSFPINSQSCRSIACDHPVIRPR